MTVDGHTSCPVSTKVTAISVNELKITAPAENGSVTVRGRTGVTYRPNPKFRGEDFFAFAIQSHSGRHNGTSLVRVHVIIS